MATKRKQEVAPAHFERASSLQEACEQYRMLADRLAKYDKRKQELAQERTKLDEAAEADLIPLRFEIHGLSRALFEFGAANRKALAGESKSFEIPQAGPIRWYNSPGAVRVVGKATRKKLEEIKNAIRRLGWGKSFLRVVEELNKEAMLASEESRAKAARIPGIKVEYGEFCQLAPEGSYRVVLDYNDKINIVPKKRTTQVGSEHDVDEAA